MEAVNFEKKVQEGGEVRKSYVLQRDLGGQRVNGRATERRGEKFEGKETLN